MGAELDRILAGANRQLDELRAAHRGLTELHTRVTSPDHRVTVTLDAFGGLVGLQLAPDAAARHGARLGDVIVDTCSVGVRELRKQRAAVLAACPTLTADQRLDQRLDQPMGRNAHHERKTS